MRLHRLISILLTIENKGKVTAAELAGQLETSVRTVYRDIDALCEAGIPLVAEPGVNGGISLTEGYQVGIRQLQQDDIISLYLNGIGVKADRKSELAMKSSSSLLKLQKLLPKEEAASFRTIVNRFYVDESPWWGSRSTLSDVDSVMKALFDSAKLEIEYRKIDGSVSRRIIRPYGIAVKSNEWYLAAYCESSRGLRIFKCERITECRTLPETFLIPDHFSLREYFTESVLNFRTGRKEQEQYPVRVRLSKESAYRLKECEVCDSREESDWVEATVNMYSFECAMRDFWNLFCSDCRVIGPDEVRNAVRERWKTLLDEIV